MCVGEVLTTHTNKYVCVSVFVPLVTFYFEKLLW